MACVQAALAFLLSSRPAPADPSRSDSHARPSTWACQPVCTGVALRRRSSKCSSWHEGRGHDPVVSGETAASRLPRSSSSMLLCGLSQSGWPLWSRDGTRCILDWPSFSMMACSRRRRQRTPLASSKRRPRAAGSRLRTSQRPVMVLRTSSVVCSVLSSWNLAMSFWDHVVGG